MKSQYKELLQHILDKGVKKEDRTGVGTISTFGYQCRFDLKEGFPIVTEKKTAFKAAITELIWMIGGWMKDSAYEGLQRTNIKFLLDNNVRIWTEWPYKAYCQFINKNYPTLEWTPELPTDWLSVKVGETFEHYYELLSQTEFELRIINDKEFAKRFGDLGPVYQKQWRDFEGKKNTVDQLRNMIDRLQSNPDCRRNLSSYWNPTELNEMLLPPCHLLHQVWTRELTAQERKELYLSGKYSNDIKLVSFILWDDESQNKHYHEWLEQWAPKVPKRAISLQMYQRSSDSFLGVPFDWVWYAALTHILAHMSNMLPDEFIWVSGDTHLYLNSIEESKAVIDSETYPYPKFNIKCEPKAIEDYKVDDFELIGYQSGKAIKVQVAV